MGNLLIRDFTIEDAVPFRVLNEAWITKFFTLEAADRLVLDDPLANIIARGGHILMAFLDGEPVGCCALISASPGVYELGKMAVAEKLRGHGIGRKILEQAIARAKEIGATSLELGTSKKLPNAIHLYESVGFRHTPPELVAPSPYQRADVHMDLALTAADRH